MSSPKATFDHAVIFVPCLERATEFYEAQGFTVTDGGDFGVIHNALIVFSDGTYLELLAVKSRWMAAMFKGFRLTGLGRLIGHRQKGMMKRFWYWPMMPHGLIDWCVRVDDVKGTLNGFEQQGIAGLGPGKFSRKGAKGHTAHWWLGGLQSHEGPFFIQDETDKDIRIPAGSARVHPNDAQGITLLVVGAAAEATSISLEGIEVVQEPVSDGCGSLRLHLSYADNRQAQFPLMGRKDV